MNNILHKKKQRVENYALTINLFLRPIYANNYGDLAKILGFFGKLGPFYTIT